MKPKRTATDNMSNFHFEIVTPDGIIYKDDVDQVSFPTPKGEITVLPHHVGIYSKLAEGEVKIKKGGKTTIIAVLGGVLEVGKTTVSLLSDYAVRAESILVAKAEEARKRAEEVLKEKKSGVDFTLSDRDLRKSILELKVARNVKRTNTPQ
jgi:F-type H+-transporting ATPase subunit epsilon